jgi:hypothetical protein
MGEEAPAEHIIATIVAVSGAYALPLVVPFIHRYPRAVLKRSIVLFSVLTTVAIAVFAMREPFDAMHQKRLFVVHMNNVSIFLRCCFFSLTLFIVVDHKRRTTSSCRCSR